MPFSLISTDLVLSLMDPSDPSLFSYNILIYSRWRPKRLFVVVFVILKLLKVRLTIFLNILLYIIKALVEIFMMPICVSEVVR